MKSEIVFLVDPLLAIREKDFHGELSLFCQKYHWEMVSSPLVADKRIHIVISSNLSKFSFEINDQIKVLYNEKNLSLFRSEDNIKLSDFQINTISDLEGIKDLIEDLAYQVRENYFNKIKSQAEKNLKTLFAKKKTSSTLILNEEYQNFLERFLAQELNQIFDLSMMKRILKSVGSEKVDLVHWVDFDVETYPNYAVFEEQEYSSYILVWVDNVNPISIYLFCKKFFGQLWENKRLRKSVDEKQKTFSEESKPLLFFMKDLSEVYQSKSFSELNLPLTSYLSLSSGQIVQVEKKRYQVLKKENETFIFCLFEPIARKNHEDNSGNDLGIISSSIAHELNNPLGGILAAIDVLMLDELSKDMEEELTAMKAGVLRAKDLVQTFLGFSKNKREESEVSLASIEECFRQAIELTRFRLIENDMKLDCTVENQAKQSIDLNQSFLTMLFYLIIGEVLTQVQRQNLIQNIQGQNIDLNLRVKDKAFELHVEQASNILDNCKQSKLSNYLLSSLKLKMKKAEDSLILQI